MSAGKQGAGAVGVRASKWLVLLGFGFQGYGANVGLRGFGQGLGEVLLRGL